MPSFEPIFVVVVDSLSDMFPRANIETVDRGVIRIIKHMKINFREEVGGGMFRSKNFETEITECFRVLR
jgi:hypothetical protein